MTLTTHLNGLFSHGIVRPLAAGVLLTLLIALAGVWQAQPTTAAESSVAVDTAGNVGLYPSIVLDGSGFPVVSYHDAEAGNQDLKILHCNDANCVGGDESITSPDTGGVVGAYTSIQLDGSGFPVISYYDATNFDLKLMHCNDVNCAGGDETINSPDTGGVVGQYTSLQLDGNAYPVVSYFDSSGSTVKILHCNDVNCAGANESITSPDTSGDNVGEYTSLQLDGSGFPVVSYWDATNFDLKVIHCNDVNCAGANESITSPDTGGDVGEYTSLQLDGSGYPVVSYFDGTNGNLKVIHCNDVNCAGANESITSPDTGSNVGLQTSLELDGSGFPVVSYYTTATADLKLLHCNDANCAGANESIASPDTTDIVGFYTSLALDGSGFPVVSHFDNTGGDLKILHCDDVNCIEEADLAVTKVESVDPVIAGSGAGNLTYTVTITNNGPVDATGITLSEVLTLPAGVTIDSITASGGTSYAPADTNPGVWTVPSLANGASETLTVVLTVDGTVVPGTDVIDNIATVTALDQTDSTPGNDSATEATSVAGATIEVCKDVVPDDSGVTEWDFALAGASSGSVLDVADGDCDTFGVRIPGSYTITETSQGGYTTSVNCGANGSAVANAITFTLDAGEQASCTFTNVGLGRLTIEKTTNPAGSTETFDFTGDLGAFSLANGGSITFNNLADATYEVVEQAEAGWALTDVDCGAATVVSIAFGVRVDVPPGADVTCTFSNTQHVGITIGKLTTPVDTAQQFNFSGDLGQFTLGNGDTLTFTGLLPGDYTVTETVPAGWTLVSATCTGGTAAATTNGLVITLLAGQAITCFFTNDDPSAVTPTPSPTPTPVPAGLVQGDNDCDGDEDAVDALVGLSYIADFFVNQQPGCPALGGAIPSAAPAGDPPAVFGDVDCDADVDPVDQLKILQFLAAIAFTQNEPCADIGQAY